MNKYAAVARLWNITGSRFSEAWYNLSWYHFDDASIMYCSCNVCVSAD